MVENRKPLIGSDRKLNIEEYRYTFSADRSVDMLAAGSEDHIRQIQCKVSNDIGKRLFEIGYTVNGTVNSVKLEMKQFETEHVSLPVPQLPADGPKDVSLDLFIWDGKKRTGSKMTVTVVPPTHFDTEGQWASDLIAKRVQPDDADVIYFANQGRENGHSGTSVCRDMTNEERTEAFKQLFRLMSIISIRDAPQKGIRPLQMPSETASNESGDSLERSCLLASMAEGAGLDPVLLFLPEGCMTGIALKGDDISGAGEYSFGMICRDRSFSDAGPRTVTERVNIIPVDMTRPSNNFYASVDLALSSLNYNIAHINADGNYSYIKQKRVKGIIPL